MTTSTPEWMRPDPDRAPLDLRTDVPHSARIYDYILGGKNNFPPDRIAAEKSLEGWPGMRTSMRQNRLFMQRAAQYLAKEAGIRQFLDVGTGIPTTPNLHEIVQAAAPTSRVVCVDNDPIVLAHARALLTSTPEGRTAYIDADLQDPESILTAPDFVKTLDVNQPIALSIIAILQFIPDEVAYQIVQRLMAPLPSGSYLALSTATADAGPGVLHAAEIYKAQGIFVTVRTKTQVAQFFDGLELIEPGIQLTHRWRPDETTAGVADTDSAMYGAIARKP